MLRFDVVAVGARSSSRSGLAAASWVSRNGSSYVFYAMSANAPASTQSEWSSPRPDKDITAHLWRRCKRSKSF